MIVNRLAVLLLGLSALLALTCRLTAEAPRPFPQAIALKGLKNTGTTRAALSPDGQVIAVLHDQGGPPPLVLYDRATGKKIRRFDKNRPTGGFNVLLFTPNGKHLVTMGCRSLAPRTDEAYVWEVATGKQLRVIPLQQRQGVDATSFQVAVSDNLLVVYAQDDLAAVYSLAAGKEVPGFTGKQRVSRMTLSRDGAWLLVLGTDKSLTVWDVAKRKLVQTLPRHDRHVLAVAISADGAWCATAAADRSLRIFDRKTGKEKARVAGMLFPSGGLLFTPDGKTLVAFGTGYPRGLHVWDWQRSKELRGGDPRAMWRVERRRLGKNPEGQDTDQASMASDATLLTSGSEGLLLWHLGPPRPPPPPPPAPLSPEPPRRKR